MSLLALALAATPAHAGPADTRNILISQDFDVPVETLWEAVALRYGEIDRSHPTIHRSVYLGGASEGGLGVERRLDFDDAGKRALHERIVAWDPVEHTLEVQLFQADGFPIDEEATLAQLSFHERPGGGSTFTFDFDYRTTPAFLGGLMASQFEDLLLDYFVALDHHLLTGEVINATTDNFDDIVAARELAEAGVPPEAAGLGKAVRLHLERDVEASADATWALLAHDYANVAAWSSTTATSWPMTADQVPVGLSADDDAPEIGRVLTSERFGEITETLVMYDEDARTFRFATGGLPSLMAYAGNTHAVHDLGDGRSRITFDVYLVPKGPMRLFSGKIERRFEAALTRTLDEAATAIEASSVASVTS